LAKFAFLMRISFNFQPKISDSLKISDFSDRLGVLQHPLAPPVDPGTAAVLLLRQSISFQVESSR